MNKNYIKYFRNLDIMILIIIRFKGILERPLIRPKFEVSLSAFAFLFSEIVQYNQNRVESIPDLEKKYFKIII